MRRNLSGSSFPAVGRRIVATRVALGLSQGAFAALCGISQTALSNYERAERRPEIAAARKIGKKVDCKLDWIYFGDKDSLPPKLRATIFPDERRRKPKSQPPEAPEGE